MFFSLGSGSKVGLPLLAFEAGSCRPERLIEAITLLRDYSILRFTLPGTIAQLNVDG